MSVDTVILAWVSWAVVTGLAILAWRSVQKARRELRESLVRGIFDVWRTRAYRTDQWASVTLTEARRTAIEAALDRTGGDWRLCMDAVQGWVHDPWQGRAEHNDVDDCLSEENLERFAEWHRRGDTHGTVLLLLRRVARREYFEHATEAVCPRCAQANLGSSLGDWPPGGLCPEGTALESAWARAAMAVVEWESGRTGEGVPPRRTDGRTDLATSG